MQKFRINTEVGKDHKITFELKQDYDLLEILSLKFTQKEAYTSFCSDYGVVCGRITANNGFGIPNARVSIFVPLTDEDVDDPVISTLYPYKSIEEADGNNYRYNLLPSRKQHSGHSPTGTFPDQQDIITREEVLEVFEKYYKYTVKTNGAGDFMIWGVPLGQQNLHVDLDLSDIGCQSLVPYDLLYEGISEEKFINKFTYKTSEDLDDLPQILSFDKSIEVYPFWGNQDVCLIGISRADFDLSEKGIRINPYAIMMGGTTTDSGDASLRMNCNVDTELGEKCRLTTLKGHIESIRFTGKFEKNADGTPNILRPILEFHEIDSRIDDKGTFFFRVPMNLKYLATDQFGNFYESNDPNVGIASEGNYRFRFTIGDDSGAFNNFVGQMLVPNIKEYHENDVAFDGQSGSINKKSYAFSINIDDYPAEAIKDIVGITPESFATGKIGVPQDYFYKFRYGRVYTVSQFINKYYKNTALGRFYSFFKRNYRRESFIGFKEIWPIPDCANNINYLPITDAVRNHKFNFFTMSIISFIEYIKLVFKLYIKERKIAITWFIAELFGGSSGARLFKRGKELQFKSIKRLNLITYPDCYDCMEDDGPNESKIIVDRVDPVMAISGKTPVATNVYVGEKYSQTRTGCDAGFFSNNDTNTHNVTYTDCDNHSQTATIPANASLKKICVKAGSTPTYDSTYISFSAVTDGCSGIAGFVDDSALYFQPTTGGYAGYQPTNIPANNQNPLNNDYLYQTYVAEIDTLGNGQSDFVTLGIGQQYPIVWDINYNQWKVQYAYGEIASTIAQAYAISTDVIPTPNNPTCHVVDGFVKIKKLWYIANIPISAVTFVEIESGCAKYDFIAESEFTDPMSLQGLVFPLNCRLSTATNGDVLTYVDARNILLTYTAGSDDLSGNAHLPYYVGGLQMFDQLDVNYPTKILNLHPDPCDTGATYNIGAVASVYGKWPSNPNGGFENETTRCILNGAYYGAGKKAGPYYVDRDLVTEGTVSGWSEFRDGVYTVIPLAGRTFELIRSYRRRKLFGKLMCGGVVSYTFYNSWLNGLLYFFKFQTNNDVYCRDCVVRVDDSTGTHFYYRSTPYNESFSAAETQYDYDVLGNQGSVNNTLTTEYSGKTSGFYGQAREVVFSTAYSTNYQYGGAFRFFRWMLIATNIVAGGKQFKREIHFPTTIVDLGPKTTWINEICTDPEMDVNCSVVRSIGTSSFRKIDDLMEYVIQSKELKYRGKLDVQKLFDNRGFSQIDGDVSQLLNFNTQVGIYPFEYEETDSPYIVEYGTLFDASGPVGLNFVYSLDDPNTPTIIERRGDLIRRCINEPGRLGDNSQRVPYYMWDTTGSGFGDAYTLPSIWDPNIRVSDGEQQSYYTGKIYNQKYQLMKSNLNPDPNTNSGDDNYFNPYILPPIRDCIEVNGVKLKANDNYKEYTVDGAIRHVMEIGGPFHYCFGIIKGASAFDKFIENFGPK
jgi:hypothetical protein